MIWVPEAIVMQVDTKSRIDVRGMDIMDADLF